MKFVLYSEVKNFVSPNLQSVGRKSVLPTYCNGIYCKACSAELVENVTTFVERTNEKPVQYVFFVLLKNYNKSCQHSSVKIM